ncbi:MAG: T9SS type A sorting domain-containing protein [Bacteroidetes bacterium]|nr:T9SS type A sorting domain-containing protein [Bacteroidota bacterium]MBU1116251.1 T9SS type A sorting domain-containing protein [Bacteroidota bacterium]MBU1799749.1 T9SS type A sorting domain-containing protein [Bacteroidota bacterium]
MRKSFLLILFALLSFSTIYSQTVSVETYGVSPRDAAVSATDIFDLAYNGLANVGRGTQIYLKATSSVALSGTQTWTVTKPFGSTAAFGVKQVLDTNAVAIVFKPDLKGTYVIVFADGGVSDTITINSGTYLSASGGNCALCHSGMAEKWNETGHATALTRGLNGLKGDHFGPNCVSCHSTGYDKNASNNGFDDFSFVFPDSLFDGQADITAALYPDAMERANIQCESCHGPASEHFSVTTDNKIDISLDAKVCAVCHDSGTHHVFPAQWDASGEDATEFDGRGFHGGHAAGAFVASTDRNGCSPCHSGAGYVQWVKEGRPVDANGLPAATAVRPEATNISCAVCHDPHDATNLYQLRQANTQLGDGTPITFEKYGTGAQCMECHRSRREAKTYASNPNNASTHYGAHHGPQADMLIGANYPDFGYDLPTSPHALGGNSCVDCHMAGEAAVDANSNPILVGGHSFNMNNAEGEDHVEACAPCHGDVGASFKEKKYFFNGIADHDGDGVAEGVQEEVRGLMVELAAFLPKDANGNVIMSSKSNSPAVMKAGYSYMWVDEDRSFGIHNPAFTVAMLKVAIESMKYGAITSGKMISVDDIMNDQGYQVRVVWTAFGADDGVAKDQVESYTILRQAPVGAANRDRSKFSSFKGITTNLEAGNLLDVNGELWDVVATVPAIRYLEYSAVVPTLQNAVEGDTVLSTFKVLGKTKDGIQAETSPMSGFSVDNLAPAVPGNVAIALDNNTAVLTWDKPVDADFNYFTVYRSETQGFIPSAENLVKTTVEPIYNDSQVESGKTYFYKVNAMDFSKNQSAASLEVNLTITDVNDIENIPTAYSLSQNYPNPFNPSTTIKFGIPEASDVQITIYDMVGNKVEVLVNDNLNAGYHTYNWNASNRASGIYFLQMTTSKFTKVSKMLLVK